MRSRLVALVIGLVAPTATLAAVDAVYAWRAAEHATVRELDSRAQALATDVARELDVSRAALLALATSPSLAAGDLAAFRVQLGRAHPPEGARVLLADPSGQQRLNTMLPEGADLPMRTGMEVQARVFATGRPQVSDLYTSPLSHQPQVTVDVPVMLDGRVAYDLAMGFSPDTFARMLQRQALPASLIASVVDENGLVIARSVDDALYVGRPLPAPTRAAVAAGRRLFETTSLNGHPLLAAAAPVPGIGWSVLVGTREDLIRATLLRSLAVTAGFAAALLSLGLLLAGWHGRRISRPLRTLVDAADSLARGRAPPAIGRGVREASRIGATLAEAATALRLRESERDAAITATRRGEARLARMLDTTPAGLVELAADGRYVYANPAAERILGARPGQLLGLRHDDPAWAITAAGGAPIRADRMPGALVLRGRTVADCGLALRGLDGHRLHLLLDAVPVRDGAGRVEGAVLAFQDVTTRHVQAEALRDSEARFRTITDAMPQMVWSARADGRHDYHNRRWRDFTGLGPLPGAGLARAPGGRGPLHAHDLRPTASAWRASLDSGEAFEAEYRLRRADGAWRWCLSRALPVRDEAGAVTRWFGTCTDIEELVEARNTLARSREELEQLVELRTAALSEAAHALRTEALERRQIEATLHQSQKMEAVGQLTGGIAHDFNNMLQAIGGSLELLQRRLAQGRVHEIGRYVETALETVERAASLTHRLLAFARRQTLQPTPTDPNALVEGMSELILRMIGPSIALELQLDADADAVLCDPSQLENVLLNLAINARDAMPAGGRLVVSTRIAAPDPAHAADPDTAAAPDAAEPPAGAPGTAAGFVEIAVADTGTGMDQVTRARAFEPFFTTKPVGQGTGLGLSQLYGFVRQSGGTVTLDSEPGHGTTVRIRLPRLDHPPSSRAHDALAAQVRGLLTPG